MKKKLIVLLILSANSAWAFTQTDISQEQLVGDWKVTGGEGEHFDEDTRGSVFHFNQSGILIADLAAIKDENEPAKQKKGFWKLSNGKLILYKENENIDKDKGVELEIRKYEGIRLYIYDKESDMVIIFERIKN